MCVLLDKVILYRMPNNENSNHDVLIYINLSNIFSYSALCCCKLMRNIFHFTLWLIPGRHCWRLWRPWMWSCMASRIQFIRHRGIQSLCTTAKYTQAKVHCRGNQGHDMYCIIIYIKINEIAREWKFRDSQQIMAYDNLHLQLGPTIVQFTEQRILFHHAPLGLSTFKTAIIQNTGMNHAYFQVTINHAGVHPDCVHITLISACISGLGLTLTL